MSTSGVTINQININRRIADFNFEVVQKCETVLNLITRYRILFIAVFNEMKTLKMYI